jgi:hypothetical protein
MSDGDSIKAGQVTLSESTTDLVGARTGEDFPNRVIFRVGPFYDTFFNCNGIMGLGNDANDHQNFGTGVIGLGSPLGGIGVQGRGGGFKPEGRPDANGGIGVQGIGGDINALNLEFVQPATGVLGIGGNASDDFNPPGTGVEGIGGASRINGGGVGVKGTGKLDAAGVLGIGDSGNGVRGDSANNDGVFGFSSTYNRSGVYGFNSTANDRAWGVTGRCNAPEGGGVFGVNGAPNGMGSTAEVSLASKAGRCPATATLFTASAFSAWFSPIMAPQFTARPKRATAPQFPAKAILPSLRAHGRVATLRATMPTRAFLMAARCSCTTT